MDTCCDAFEAGMDKGLRTIGPVFVLVAISLISMCIASFFEAVFGQAFLDRCSPGMRALHAVCAIWICFSIIFNYVMCIYTKPGYTQDVSDEELHMSVPRNMRWCSTCGKPKPPLAHHCSVCKQCVLAMDHHCPWVNNCIGFYNYRFFFLFLFWLTVGCIYEFVVLANRYAYRLVPGKFERAHSIAQIRQAQKVTSLLALMLSGSLSIAVGAMLLWHTYLVLSAQGTIDFYSNRLDAAAARKKGKIWINIFDGGAKRNWQERFDAYGPLWWLLWAVPSIRKKRGNGYMLPMKKGWDDTLAVAV